MFVDLVAYALTPTQLRLAAELSCFVSAFLIGPFFAFAVTNDAGFHSPLAFLRLVQRWALVGLSIALLYLWIYFLQNDDYVPAGPALLVLIGVLVTTSISAVRHMLAPPITDNTWGSAWHDVFHQKTAKPLPAADSLVALEDPRDRGRRPF